MTAQTQHQLRELADELSGLMLLSVNAVGRELERLQELFTDRLREARRLGYRARFTPGEGCTVWVEWDQLPQAGAQ
jgi:hypothetical protein